MGEERVDGRTLRYQHRRRELSEAVLDHLLEHGLHGISYRTLAAGVGLSHVTLRHHFGTKDELLLAVFEIIRMREPVPDELAQDQTPEEILRDLWAWWTAPENLRYFRLLYEAYGLALQQPETYRRFLDRSIVDHWLDDVRFLATQAGCPPDRVDALATLTVAQLQGLLLDLLTTGDRSRVEQALDLLIDGITAERRGWKQPH